jgi:hypothetical protein
VFERPVVSAFGVRRKKAGGELPAAQVIPQAIATFVFIRARFVTAIAVTLVLRLFAFHVFLFSIYGIPCKEAGCLHDDSLNNTTHPWPSSTIPLILSVWDAEQDGIPRIWECLSFHHGEHIDGELSSRRRAP